jgi:hypothetical protein
LFIESFDKCWVFYDFDLVVFVMIDGVEHLYFISL